MEDLLKAQANWIDTLIGLDLALDEVLGAQL